MKKESRRPGKKTGTLSISIAVTVIMVMLAIVTVCFCVLLGRLNILNIRYFLIVCITLVVILLLLFLMLRRFRISVRCIFGLLFTFVYLAVIVLGSSMIKHTLDALTTITTIRTEVTEMVVYVRTEDVANDLSQVRDYEFGIMAVQNREVSDSALRQLEATFNSSVVYSEFDGPVALINGLLNYEIDAIVFSSDYFSMISEMEGLEDVDTRVRPLTTFTVTVEKEVTEEKDDKNEDHNSTAAVELKPHENHVITMYITGIDTYGSISNTSRSDVNILAVINLDTKQISLISTPRDYYVPLSNSNGHKDKLTHAGIYGVDVSIATLEMLYGVKIDYYFRVNFSGFKTIVDALDGINVDNDVSFTSDRWNGGYYYEKGRIHLNGDEALAYVRERMAFSDGDFARGRHQMLVIKAIIDKCMSLEVLTHFTDLLNAVEGNFETSMPYDVMSDIIQDQIDNLGGWNIVSYSVSGYGDMLNCWSLGTNASVVVPNYDTVDVAKKIVDDVMEGKVPQIPN